MPKMNPPPTATEVAKFRQWAQEHYVPLSPIADWWHDIIKDEALRINMAQARDVLDEEELTEALEAEAFELSMQKARLPSFPPPAQSGSHPSADRTMQFATDILREMASHRRQSF
jgi:hypothetical protein